MSVALTQQARDVLERATVDGNVVRLPDGQLDRPTYTAVDKVLVAMGGKWDRKKGGHAFPFDPAEKLAAALDEGSFVKRQQALQHFDTPEGLAERLVAMLKVTPEDYCLEPSAGRGRIVAALAKRRPFDLTAIEIDADNGRVLKAQGLCTNLFIKDFMTCRTRELRDVPITVIAMNPPFRGNQDIRHVLHAYEALSPGGRLAAIVSEHGFIGRERECVDWRNWLDEVGATIEIIPAGTFKESGTGVQTRMIFVRKDKA